MMEDLMVQNITITAAYKAAETYEQFFVKGIYRYWTPLLLKRAAPKPGERALDVACGTGVVARSMVPLVGERGKVVGLDINPSMLEVACKQFSDHCDEIDWREGRAENLPFPNSDFDLVTCQQGLQFFNRPVALREMHRVLRPNGRAAIAVWQSLDQNPFYKTVFGAVAAVFNIPVAEVAKPFASGDPDEIKGLFEEAGFRRVRVESVRSAVHFPDVDHFVERTILSASVVIPAFASMDMETRSDLMARVNQQLAGFLSGHTSGGVLSFPMTASIATGVR
jgi:ubiquinone/menaquinone biosynthesis C-methylase UbiE